MIVDYAEKHGNKGAGRKFNLNESTPRQWRNQKSKLEALAVEMSKEKPNEDTVLAKAMQRRVKKPKRKSISLETKLEMFLLSEEDGVPAAASKLNVSEDTVRRAFLRLNSKLEKSAVSVERKLEILAFADVHGLRAAAREYKISVNTPGRWRKMKPVLERLAEMRTAESPKSNLLDQEDVNNVSRDAEVDSDAETAIIEFVSDESPAWDSSSDESEEERSGDDGEESGEEGDETFSVPPQQSIPPPDPFPLTQDPFYLQDITLKEIKRDLSAQLGIAENNPKIISKVEQFLQDAILEASDAENSLLEKAAEVEAYVDSREGDSERSQQVAKFRQTMKSWKRRAFEFHMVVDNLVKQKAKLEAILSNLLDIVF